MTNLSYRNQVERDEKKAIIAAGQNVADRAFTAEEVREGSRGGGVRIRGGAVGVESQNSCAVFKC